MSDDLFERHAYEIRRRLVRQTDDAAVEDSDAELDAVNSLCQVRPVLQYATAMCTNRVVATGDVPGLCRRLLRGHRSGLGHNQTMRLAFLQRTKIWVVLPCLRCPRASGPPEQLGSRTGAPDRRSRGPLAIPHIERRPRCLRRPYSARGRGPCE